MRFSDNKHFLEREEKEDLGAFVNFFNMTGVCELVELYTLNKGNNDFENYSVGLY